MGMYPGRIEAGDGSAIAVAARAPEDIFVLAAGGDGGRYSSIINLAIFKAKTRKIETPGA